jgi:hypothetical protein
MGQPPREKDGAAIVGFSKKSALHWLLLRHPLKIDPPISPLESRADVRRPEFEAVKHFTAIDGLVEKNRLRRCGRVRSEDEAFKIKE